MEREKLEVSPESETIEKTEVVMRVNRDYRFEGLNQFEID